jgi:carboxyl-terminal processing protease
MAIDKSVPIAVLINRMTASASEIVGACFQDHQRARIVGQRTWGKGTVQNILQLEGGRSALKLTTASYWRPSEKNIHRRKGAQEEDDWGVRPCDGFEVILTDEQADQVHQQRRQRDAYFRNDQQDSEDSQDDQFVDPQLRRAIDYLEERLGESGTG